MPSDIVHTSTMDWRTQCLLVEANDRLDGPQDGIAAIEGLDPRPVVYVFSNRRRFRDRRNPYA